VSVLLDGHLLEHPRRLRVAGGQALRVPAIDARVVFLGRDREREDLLLGEVLELPSVRDAWDHEVPFQGGSGCLF
jgi:hypothetical protein